MVTREELRQGTHDKVMSSAERLFRKRGYRATTVRDIATDAGVSVGSVMAVGDKARLLVAMFDRSIGEIHVGRKRDGVPQARTGPDANPADRLLEVVAPFLAIFAEDTQLSREYSAILTSGDHDSALFHGLADDLIHEFAVVLGESGMDPKDVEVAAKAIYFAYLGVIRASAAKSGSHTPDSVQEMRDVFSYIASPRG
ncbi:TetR/AcrR family transcriptional regulator [Nocardioides jensenii]|uniref:TetR/AcrR family transcriptional regulator n=1 Tax=Nocardioides jensenii TaxID=1843 RepID=UPI0008361113|nr:TetR/AcrR family transcriptional regulator [Nocardioides jensenii]